MKPFIVSCDFRGCLDTESAVTGILNKYNGIRLKLDMWVIITSDNTEKIADELKECSQLLYFFIAEIKDNYELSQPNPVEAWFRKNCGVLR